MRKWLWTCLMPALTWAGTARAEEPGLQAKDNAAPPVVDMAPADVASAPLYTYADAPAGPRLWFSTEYLLWWIEDHPVAAPLLSTGAIGAPGTAVLLGGADLATDVRSGVRFTGGGWLNADRTLGAEASYFLLAQTSDSQTAGTDATGAPPLVFPFLFNVGVGAPVETGFLLAGPGFATGSTTLSISSRLEGAEISGLARAYAGDGLAIDLIGGFRYLSLEEALTLTSTATLIGGGASIGLTDEFGVRNQFYAGQLGVRASLTRGRFFADMTNKVALGDMRQEQDITGLGQLAIGAVTTGFVGGIYAQPSNSGSSKRREFGALYELTLNVGANLTDNIRAFAGYNFLVLGNVLRPGDQVDRNINPSQFLGGTLAGSPLPAPQFNDGSFWVQGLNFGIEVRY